MFELNKCGTLWPDNLMCFFRFFLFRGLSIYFLRNLSRLIGNCSKPDLGTGDGTTNLFKSWIPANLSDILITHWNCYPFCVCNKETISNLICVVFNIWCMFWICGGGLVWFGQSIIFNFRRVPVAQKVVARVPHPIKDFLPGLNLPRRAG